MREAAPPSSPPSALGVLAGCPTPLQLAYDVALLDLDGVVYLGGRPIETAAPALAAARTAGMRLAFVTNNASRPPDRIAELLTGQGVPARAEEIVTSAQAAVRILRERFAAGAAVLVVGADGLWQEVVAAGFRAVGLAAEAPAAVVQGYDETMSYDRLAEAALAVRAGVPWIATNADATMPSPRGQLPGNGALLAVVTTATGRYPEVAGKPAPALHRECLERTGAHRPLVVGDRLDTDIEGAVAAGSDSLLVLTGVTDAARLLTARQRERPTYLGADLGALGAAHPGVLAEGSAHRCAGWRASARGAELRLSGAGETGDALRALCAAAWAAADAGTATVRVSADGGAAADTLRELRVNAD